MTVFTIDRLGRKPIQIGGFAILTIISCILGFAWKGLTKVHLLVLYVLAQFFFNFGKYTVSLNHTEFNTARSQRHDIHHARRDLPHTRPFNWPRHFRWLRQARRRDRPGLLRTHDQT